MNKLNTVSEKEKIEHNIQSKIEGKNIHSVYTLCIKHGFGIHKPYERECPDCGHGDDTILYISAEDVNNLIRQELSSAKREIVICSAIRWADGTIIRGHRHNDCFADSLRIKGILMAGKYNKEAEQGFITSTNRFVDRKEAFHLQMLAGIKSVAPDGYRGDELYSEDLY